MKAFRKNLNRLISMVCILSMLFGVLVPFGYRQAKAETEYAHTVNLFSIDVRDGASYYNQYPKIDKNGVYVWKADSSSEGHKFVYNIKFSMSGEMLDENQNTVEFVKFRIPAHILKDQNGNYADQIEMPVSNINDIEQKTDPVTGETIYVSKYDFVYRTGIDPDTGEEYYEIYNIFPVSTGQVYEFPIAYMTTKPTWEYKDVAPSEDCFATATINSWQRGGEQSQADATEDLVVESNRIPVYIDTSVNLKSTSKKAETGLLSAEDAGKAAGVSGLDENYRYIWWSVTSDITDVTQRYNLTLNDIPGILSGTDGEEQEHSVQGEVELIKIGGTVYRNDSGGDDSFSAEITGLTATGKRVDYVLLRYPYELTAEEKAEGKEGIKDLEEAPKDAEYIAVNDAEMTLQPADGVDPDITKTDEAYRKWENKNPKWNPIVTKYDVKKYGLYNNGKSRVSNKNNISNYTLEELAKGNDISGLKYEIYASAYAYGKTVEEISDEINALTFPATLGETVTELIAGSRKYIFTNNDTEHYRVVKYADDTQTGEPVYDNVKDIPAELSAVLSLSEKAELSLLDMQKIAALDINLDYYGKEKLTYVLEDDTFELIPDVTTPSDNNVTLNTEEYKIDSVDYSFTMRNYVYDMDNMSYVEGEKNRNYDESDDSVNLLKLYVKKDDDENYGANPVATINIRTGAYEIADDSVVKYISDGCIMFAQDADVTGYKFEITNKYFYNEIHAWPQITLKGDAASRVKERAVILTDTTDPEYDDDAEKKIGVKNTAEWHVAHPAENIYDNTISGTDYVAGITRSSKLTKQAMGERFSYIGQDGNEYKSTNDTFLGQYRLRWQVKLSETANGMVPEGGTVPQDNVPVPQESGIFYDLLPAHSDIIEGSVNVYVDLDSDATTGSTALSPASFEVLDRIDNWAGSGQKLLIIKINSPCKKSYTVNYVTVHAHEDIQDFSSMALNSVAYQTGNADIGGGYPDNGGNYELTMHEYIKNLDPDNNGAKRFVYAQALKDILALFPKSSGIYKKVATKSNPSYSRTGVVHPGETYTYNIRMKNDSTTKATDIAILDSIENYRTYDGTIYNTGLYERDWAGTLQGFDLSGIVVRMEEYDAVENKTSVNDLKAIVYVGDGEDDIVNLEDQIYSDANARKYLLCTILGNYTDAENAVRNALREEAESDPDFPWGGTDAEKNAFKDDYASDTTRFNERKAFFESEYTVEINKWKILKDWEDITVDKDENPIDPEKISAFIIYTGKNFVLPMDEGLSFNVKMKAPDNVEQTEVADPDNGVFIYKPRTYNNVYRSFTTAREDTATHQNTDLTYFYTHYDYTQIDYCVTGTVQFYKADYSSGEGISGVEFSLSGVSDYGTIYNETLTSDSQGYVIFKNLERGTYQLLESVNDPDHVLDTTARTVMIDPQGEFTFVNIDGDEFVYDENEGYAGEDKEYVFLNLPRAHGEFEFTKKDSLTGEGVQGAVFTLKGISDYGTVVDITAESDANGRVSFGDIEKGSNYVLTEVKSAEGYMPPENNTFTVSGTGDRLVDFTISGGDPGMVSSLNGAYTISNEPLADMILQKNDAITKEFLSGVKFVLTRDVESENDKIELLYDKIIEQYVIAFSSDETYANYTEEEIEELAALSAKNRIKWEKNDLEDKWVIELDSGNETGRRDYLFEYMPEGEYTLTEQIVPDKYEKAYENQEFTVTVTKDATNNRFNITFSPDKNDTTNAPYMQYVKLENAEYVSVTSSEAEAYRILNFEKYEDNKDVIKSWVGSVQNAPQFPVLHMSSEATEVGATKVTIGSKLKELLQNSDVKTSMTAFIRSNTLPSDVTEGSIPAGFMANDTFAGEDGLFYAWQDPDSKIVYWWSNADIIYLPSNCSSLFAGCANTEFKNLDLSKFYVDKVTTFASAFKGCSNLQTIKFNNFEGTNFKNGSRITSTKEMFKDCAVLENVDLSNLVTSESLTITSYMFDGCQAVESIDITSLNVSKVTDMSYMFRNCQAINALDLSNFGICDELTTMEGMFTRCYYLKFIDLSKFETNSQKFENVKSLFEFTGTGSDKDGNTAAYYNPDVTGDTVVWCSVFAKGKWNCKSTISLNNVANFFRIKIYGNPYKEMRNINKEALDVATYSGENQWIQESVVDNNYHRTKRLFNATTGVAEEYYLQQRAIYFPENSSSSGSSGNGSSTGDNGEPDSYLNFTLKRSSDLEEVSAIDDDLGKTFKFEYITGSTGTQVGSTYTVPEELYLTVTEIYKDSTDDKYYKVIHEYKYDKPLTAVWTNVSNEAPSQWYCKMKVNNAEDDFYVWEDAVEGFESTADGSTEHPAIKTSGDDETAPVITNSKDTQVGGIRLKKALSSDDLTKYDNDSFWFRVEMWTDSTKEYHYTLLPFGNGTDGEEGVAYFKLEANDPDGVVINGIPAGCYYEVREVDMDDTVHVQPEGYSFVSLKTGEVVSEVNSVGGQISPNDETVIEAKNTIDRTSLTVSKATKAFVSINGGEKTELTDTEDDDYDQWSRESFDFVVYFNNLEKGRQYTYKVYDSNDAVITGDSYENGEQHFFGNPSGLITSVSFTLKSGWKIVFEDLPVDTEYTVTETSEFEESVDDFETKTYTTKYKVSGGNTVDETEGNSALLNEEWITLKDDDDTVAFTNELHLQRPDTISVVISKEWYDKNNTLIQFELVNDNNDEKVVATAGTDTIENLSFIRVILGRALVYNHGEETYYLDPVTSYIEYDINVKSLLQERQKRNDYSPLGSWSYEFKNLEKTGETYVVENGENKLVTLNYVYFVSEVCPTGYKNENDETDKLDIGDRDYFEVNETEPGSGKYEYTLKNKQQETYKLSLTKIVSGNMGDMTKQFAFDITFRDENGKLFDGTVPVVYHDEITDTDRNRTATIVSGKLTVSLPHGKTVTIANLPKGTSYVIKEKTSGAGGSVIKSGEITGNSPMSVDYSGFDETSQQSGMLEDSDAAYLFVNDVNGKIPTGVNLSFKISLLFGSALALAVVYFVLKKRKESGEEQ